MITMEHSLQFHQNAKVLTTYGEEVGNLTRVVMNPDTKIVTHIVVRKKGLFDNEENSPIYRSLTTKIKFLRDADAGCFPFEEKRRIREDWLTVCNPDDDDLYAVMWIAKDPLKEGSHYIDQISLRHRGGERRRQSHRRRKTWQGRKKHYG
jgi:sporulation protein YlmC with PRC-barrel domain